MRSYPVTMMNSFKDFTICILTSLFSQKLMSSIAMGYNLFEVTSSPHSLHILPKSLERESFTLLFESFAKFFIAGIIILFILSTLILSIQIHILLSV